MKDNFRIFCLFVQIHRDASMMGDIGDEWAYGGNIELVGMPVH